MLTLGAIADATSLMIPGVRASCRWDSDLGNCRPVMQLHDRADNQSHARTSKYDNRPRPLDIGRLGPHYHAMRAMAAAIFSVALGTLGVGGDWTPEVYLALLAAAVTAQAVWRRRDPRDIFLFWWGVPNSAGSGCRMVASR
jgi:hypothetical protein